MELNHANASPVDDTTQQSAEESRTQGFLLNEDAAHPEVDRENPIPTAVEAILAYGEYSRPELMALLDGIDACYHATFLLSVLETERRAHRDRQRGRRVVRPHMVPRDRDLDRVD